MTEPCWTTRAGKQIPVSRLEDQHLVNLLRMLQKHAEVKRRAIVELYFDLPPNWASLQGHFDQMHDEIMQQTWRDFADDVFFDLEQEGARRRLQWDLYQDRPIFCEDREIDMVDRSGLRRAVTGAIRDAIGAHGPITRDNASSAVKRIFGAIQTYNHGLRRKV